MSRIILALAATFLIAGCPRTRVVGPTDAAADTLGVPDTGSPPDGDRPPPTATGELDLLLMMDNSNDMAEQQTALAMQLPRLFTALADRFDSIHVGVVTSDMGSGGFAVPTCTEPNFGDDGVLRTTGNLSIPGCSATYPTFLAFDPATGDTRAFIDDVACVAITGTGGCGFEQPLEAVLKAVTPSSLGPTGRFDGVFSMGTSGHADGANAGFLRPGAMLALVLLTKEPDCSALDPELFNPDSSIYTGDLNLRCWANPGAVQPVERYVDGLAAGRDPRLIYFVPIVGIPAEIAGRDPEEILAHPVMIEELDPLDPTRLRPSCNVPGLGLAFPPRRIVEVGRQLEGEGAHVTIQSTCQTDLTPAIDGLLALLP